MNKHLCLFRRCAGIKFAGQLYPSQAMQPTHEADGGITYEVNPDFLEHLHREIFSSEQGQLLWDE